MMIETLKHGKCTIRVDDSEYVKLSKAELEVAMNSLSELLENYRLDKKDQQNNEDSKFSNI